MLYQALGNILYPKRQYFRYLGHSSRDDDDDEDSITVPRASSSAKAAPKATSKPTEIATFVIDGLPFVLRNSHNKLVSPSFIYLLCSNFGVTGY